MESADVLVAPRKTFIVDTSVLLYDKMSISSFPENDVVMPLVVLDELDRFKDKPGILGENARYVNRFLDDLRKGGKLHDGVRLDNGQTIRIDTSDLKAPQGLEQKSGDNRIVGLALQIMETGVRTIVVTKDINFRVKCDALGIEAEDFWKDNVDKKTNSFSGVTTILVEEAELKSLYEGSVLPNRVFNGKTLSPNECAVVKSTNSESISALAIRRPDGVTLIPQKKKGGKSDVEPKNKEQRFALHLLEDENIPLVTLTGIAGSGKTYLALMVALDKLLMKKVQKIIITRPIIPVGKDLGYLPGDIGEKMAPWLRPIIDNFRDGYGEDLTYWEKMIEKGDIEIAPLSYIRGRTFNDAFIIVDEAQNATIHELKTIITRAGRNTKVVCLGDTEQVDAQYIDTYSNGLSIVVEKFKEEWESGHVRLPRSERSKLAAVASKIL